MPAGVPLTLPSIRNAVINGDCVVSQITQSPGTTLFGPASTLTRWFNIDMIGIRTHGTGVAGQVSDQQIADHPILGARGFCKSITVVNASPAPGAAAGFIVFTSIEGNNFRLLDNQVCTLSFQVKSPKTGLHCVAFTNNVDRSFIREFVIAQANTWEQKVTGIPFDYVGGTWDYANGLGLRICFPLWVGANFYTQPNAWQNGLFYATANQQNLTDTVGNVFRVTDIQIETGFVGTSFDRLPFDVQLTRAQRYYQQSFTYGTVPQQNIGINTGEVRFDLNAFGFNVCGLKDFNASMRANPTITFYNPAAANALARNISTGADCTLTQVNGLSTERISANVIGDAAAIQGDVAGFHFTADARI